MTKLPRLLDASLKETRRLHPISLSITEKMIPLSYATMSVTEEEFIGEREWVELYTPNGSAGIFRSKTPSGGYGTEAFSVELEHGITEVGDYLVIGAINKDARLDTAIKEIFSYYRGNRWKLGSIAGKDPVTIDVDYDNVLEAILGLLEQATDYCLSYNFATTPWTVNVIKKPTNVTAEGRLSRNIKSATVKRDDTDLCTRIYVKGLPKPAKYKNDDNILGYQDAPTIKKYGIVEHQESGSDYTEKQAIQIANNYLKTHSEPKVSVEIDGIDLSQITGETLDKFAVGKLFRLAIPQHKVTITDHVTTLAWADVINNPMSVRVSLGDTRDPVLQFYQTASSTSKSVSKGATKTVKRNKEFSTHFEQNDKQIIATAEQTDLNGKIIKQAGLYIDKDGVLQYANDYKNSLFSKFKVASDKIEGEVENRQNQDKILAGKLEIMSSKVSLLVGTKDKRTIITRATRTGKNGFPEAGNAKYIYYAADEKRYYEWKNGKYVLFQGDGLTNMINPGGIVSAINADDSIDTAIKGTRIWAGTDPETMKKYNLPDWMDTTSGLIAEKATIANLEVVEGRVQTLEADSITTGNLRAEIGNLESVLVKQLGVKTGGIFSSPTILITGQTEALTINVKTALQSCLAAVQITGPTNNVYKLQYKTFGSDQWQDAEVTFSRAVTDIGYRWIGSTGRLAVTAYPQNYSENPLLGLTIVGSWSGNTYNGQVKYYEGTDDEHTYAISGMDFTIDASEVYDYGYVAGWNAARAKVSRNGNSIYIPKTRSGTDTTTNVGLEVMTTAVLNSGTPRAKSQYRIKTPGGTGSWTGTKNYQDVGEYAFNSSMTLEYRSTGGYYGTSPSISWT